MPWNSPLITTIRTKLKWGDAVGENSSTPTSTTILGRLKTLNDGLGTETNAPANGTGVRGWLQSLYLVLAAFSAKFSTIGQNTMAGSASVTIASDQSSVPIVVTAGTAAGNAIGEVSASPTANTILGRLKAAYDAILGRPYVIDVVSTINSVTATVAGSGTWEASSWEDLDGFNSIRLTFGFTAPAAANGLILQWSHDGIDPGPIEPHEINYTGANGDIGATIPKQARYLRAKFLNGASSNDVVLTIVKTTAVLPHSHPIGMPMYASQLGSLGMNTIIGQKPDGTYTTASFDGHGRIITSTAETGASRAGFAFGEVATASSTAVPVRKTTLTEQTTNAQRSIVSASASDTAAGTGARTVEITYFDQTVAGPFYETVTLNGTTAVNTVATNICYVESLKVLTVGSGGQNAGVISLKAATGGGGATVMSITAGDNRTLLAMRYVPVGEDVHITNVACNSTATTVGSGASFHLRAQNPLDSSGVNQIVTDTVRIFGQGDQVTRPYRTPIRIEGPARVQLWVTPENGSAVTQRGAFEFYQEPIGGDI